MVHFHEIPVELKWMFLDSLRHEDGRGPSRLRRNPRELSQRTFAISALRLTDKRNAHDYAPMQGQLRAAQITLDSYGVQQLQWLAKTSIAPYVTDLELIERVVLPHVAIYDALGDRSLLPKNLQKRVKKLSAKKDDALFKVVKDHFKPGPHLEYRPWTQTKQEWSSNERELKPRCFGVRNISDNELRALLDDDGSECNIDLIRSTLSAFPSVAHIETWQMFAAKRVWLHPSGLETDIPMLYRWLATSISSQGWRTCPRAPFSANVYQLLRDLPTGTRIRSVALPAWSHGSDAVIRPYDRPDKQSITRMFSSMPNLAKLSLYGEPRSWSEFSEDQTVIHATCRALTSHPLSSLRHLEIMDCHVTRAMTDMIKAHKLTSLTMNGLEKRYSAESFLHISNLLTILEIARDTPLRGLFDIWDFTVWYLLPKNLRLTDPGYFTWHELDARIKSIKELREHGKLQITDEESDEGGSLWGDEIFTSGGESPQFSNDEAESSENVVFNTIA